MGNGGNGSSVAEVASSSRRAMPRGPDWSAVTFEVSCGRCGASLVGQTEPQCPQCTLEFDWDDVLPIERLKCPHCAYGVYGLPTPRCPECGEFFQWSQVLAVARSRSHHLFESQWFKEPVPSLARTWALAAFQPRRLWSHYDVHDPPKLAPLAILVALQWLIFTYGWDVPALLATWSMNRLSTAYEVGLRFTYFVRTPRGFFVDMALWHVLTFTCLLMFVQSRRQFRVRWQHLLRVYAHATVLASMVPVAWLVFEWAVDFGLLCSPWLRRVVDQRVYQNIWLGLFGLALLATWRHLWVGYRDYLKVPRGWGIAALAMLLGNLLARLVGIYL